MRLPGDRWALHRLGNRPGVGRHGLPGARMRARRQLRRHQAGRNRRPRERPGRGRADALRDRRPGELCPAGRDLRFVRRAHGAGGRAPRARDRRARLRADRPLQGFQHLRRRLSRRRIARRPTATRFPAPTSTAFASPDRSPSSASTPRGRPAVPARRSSRARGPSSSISGCPITPGRASRCSAPRISTAPTRARPAPEKRSSAWPLTTR
ncbi:MAG: hypothetical protein H6R20_1823 [Proteobacteria bacterium]|nr:hypothetical protein [Pseudomonadota bacterium]